MTDMVNQPPHYTSHPSGVECIQITEHMNFCLGNALKYIWRAGLKDNDIQDLEKAIFYINREISRRKELGRQVQCTTWRESSGPVEVLATRRVSCNSAGTG